MLFSLPKKFDFYSRLPNEIDYRLTYKTRPLVVSILIRFVVMESISRAAF